MFNDIKKYILSFFSPQSKHEIKINNLCDELDLKIKEIDRLIEIHIEMHKIWTEIIVKIKGDLNDRERIS